MSDPWYTVATYTPVIGWYYWCRFIHNDKGVMGVCTYLGDDKWESKLLDDEGNGTWTTFHIPSMEFQEFWNPKG